MTITSSNKILHIFSGRMAYGLLDGMASRDLALCFLLSALLYSTIGKIVKNNADKTTG